MRAALLALARAEVNHFGYVKPETRDRLGMFGVTAVQLEQYLSFTGGII